VSSLGLRAQTGNSTGSCPGSIPIRSWPTSESGVAKRIRSQSCERQDFLSPTFASSTRTSAESSERLDLEIANAGLPSPGDLPRRPKPDFHLFARQQDHAKLRRVPLRQLRRFREKRWNTQPHSAGIPWSWRAFFFGDFCGRRPCCACRAWPWMNLRNCWQGEVARNAWPPGRGKRASSSV